MRPPDRLALVGEQAPWILEAAGIEGIVLCEAGRCWPDRGRDLRAERCRSARRTLVTS